MTNREKNNELLNLMDILCSADFSKDIEFVDNWISKLRDIYSDHYRHSYSDIFFKLQQIIPVSEQSEVLEILGENLNVIENRINELSRKTESIDSFQNVLAGYKKFSDHIKLEIGRYNFIKARFSPKKDDPSLGTPVSDKVKQQLDRLKETTDKMKPIILQAKMKADDADKTLNQVKEKFNGIDEKLENNKISSITTLTIFSAVILAFSGGITFESGIFKGMVESSPYRLVFTIALSGFILFNTIFVLLYLVGKMAGKQISTKCKYLTNDSDNYSQCQSCGDGYCIKEYTEVSIACRFFHKYSYVFAVNIVLLYILYAVFFLWLSKGVLLDPRFYLSQGLLILFFGVFLAVYYVRKYIRLYKIKLHYRVSILEDIVESQMPISTLKGFHEVSPRPFYQAIPKSEKDSFLNKVQNMTRKKALKYFKEFVDEYRISNCRLLIHVTKQEHKINRKKWKELKKKFNSLIPSCRKNTILKHIGNFFKQH